MAKRDALAVLNSHFVIGKSNQETAIFRINDDGTITFLPPEQFKLEVQNILVNVGTNQSTQVGFGRQVLERTPQASPEETCIQARRHDRAE